MRFDRNAALAGTFFALFVSATPWFQEIPLSAKAGFSGGLFLTYASIGCLVALGPACGHRIRTGALIGFLYSLPGAVFTSVPYPLAAEAATYYREFASGGGRAFCLTLIFGALAGAFAGFFRRSP